MSDLIERLRKLRDCAEETDDAEIVDDDPRCVFVPMLPEDFDALLREAADALEAARADTWQPIETAPKDGAEILAWRTDCGILLVRWTAPVEFLTPTELEAAATGDDDWMETPDWFCADFVSGCRLDGPEAPTHWRPLPAPPRAMAAEGLRHE